MGRKGYRSGAALVTALVMTGVSALVVGAVLGYVSHASRMTGYYEGKNICRLAAQSEIELAKAAINYRFELSLNRSARIIGGDTFGASTSSYDWFEAYGETTAKKTIGAKNTLTLADSVTNNGCVVKVRIGRVEHTIGDQWADVTLVAEATRQIRGGVTSRSIVEETIRFAQQRSKVFNNAYFVNNFGWFYGDSSTKVNGDIRSNGDMALSNDVIINGHIYAARNDELNAAGNVTDRYGRLGVYGAMVSKATYMSANYGGAANSMARPLELDPVNGSFNKGGYAAPDQTPAAGSSVLKARTHANGELSVEMPYIGEICYEGSEYRLWIDELRADDANICKVKVGDEVKIDKFFNGPGPSGETYFYDSNGNNPRQAPDYGAIVLEGTWNDPIEINGPVVVASDVIIKGYVTGQGTIYSGRNIHIVGDIIYKNPPSWEGRSSAGSDNKNADMLGLMAKGNIVLGNYADTKASKDQYGRDKSWVDTIYTYLTDNTYVKRYACDTSDANIGYPATFGGSYVAAESVPASQLTASAIEAAPGGCKEVSGSKYQFGKDRGTTKSVKVGSHQETYTDVWGRTRTRTVDDYEDRRVYSYDRKYYESVCKDTEISSRANSKIRRIDAVLYNNHGIMGCIGECSFNGALVCRNEAISYSTGLVMNWDMRLYSGSSETVENNKVGLARASDNPPQVIDWRELPEGVVTFD